MVKEKKVDSILTSIKKLLGIDVAYTHFDDDIIMHINSVFFTLHQLGVGEVPFVIESDSETWDDFLSNTNVSLEVVKSYIYLKVRLLFDPPTNSALLNSMNEMIKEYEWRINVAVDPEEKEN